MKALTPYPRLRYPHTFHHTALPTLSLRQTGTSGQAVPRTSVPPYPVINVAKCVLAFVCLQMLAYTAHAQIELVKDINTQPQLFASGRPENLTVVGDWLFFSAETNVGRELWKTDGTQAGTAMVADIEPGIESSSPRDLVALNNMVIFRTYNPSRMTGALWRSDGTQEGTIRLQEAGSIHGISNGQLVAANNQVFFTRQNSESLSTEFWKTDGTFEGTMMVKSFDNRANLSSITEVNGDVFFVVSSFQGWQLWKSDGTEEGTVVIKSGDQTFFAPTGLISFQGKLFFSGHDPLTGYELWTSDGTPEGTEMVTELAPGSNPSHPSNAVIMDGLLYFIATNGTNYGIYRTDGTAGGTELLIQPAAGSFVGNLIASGGKIYYTISASGSIALWNTDGTASGSQQLSVLPATPSNLSDVYGVLYFTLQIPATGDPQLWKSAGTPSETSLVSDLPNVTFSPPRLLTAFNNALYFSAEHSELGTELWTSDGTNEGTVVAVDIIDGNASSFPEEMVTVGNLTFFRAYDGVHGPELWKTDGTAGGTTLIKDLVPGEEGSHPTDLVDVNGELFFLAQDNGHYYLCKSNGTTEGTVILKDMGSNRPSIFVPSGGLLFFVHHDGVGATGLELWKSDGTEEGTAMVKDINAGLASTSFAELFDFNGVLYFSASTTELGAELWRSDGTDAGTYLVKDIEPGFSGSTPQELIDLDGILYFSARTSNGFELWKSDGTSEGTTLVNEAVDNVSSPNTFMVHNHELYFFAVDPSTRQQLFMKTDGTAGGTVELRRFSGLRSPKKGTKGDNGLTHVSLSNGLLFISASDTDSGDDLWRTDGTPEGTGIFLDVPASLLKLSTNITHLTVINDELYFMALDESLEMKLWKTNGMECGTVKLPSDNAWIYEIAPLSGNLIVSGGLYDIGDELFIYNTDNDPATDCILSQTITFDLPAEIDLSTGSISLTATASSGLPVSYSVSDETVARLEGNVLILLKTGTLTVTVSQEGNDEYHPAEDVSRELTITGTVPTVYLTSPADQEINLEPTLRVMALVLDGATTYTIEINTSPLFDGASIVGTGGRSQAFDLAFNTTYFARVKTDLSDEYGTITSFTTAPAEFFAFVTSPEDGETNTKTKLKVTSNKVPRAQEYTIELNIQDDFSGPAITQTGGNSLRFADLENATTYFARVKTDQSPLWGRVTSFTTEPAKTKKNKSDGSARQGTTEESTEENNPVVPDGNNIIVDAYPNLFTNRLQLTIISSYDGPVRIAMFDIHGRKVHDVSDQTNRPVVIEKELPKGVYVVRVQTPRHHRTVKVIRE